MKWKATDTTGVHPPEAHTFKVGVIGEVVPAKLDHLLSRKTNVEIVCHAENESAIAYAKDRGYDCSPRSLGKHRMINVVKARAGTIAGYCNAIVFFEDCEYTRIYAKRCGKDIRRWI